MLNILHVVSVMLTLHLYTYCIGKLYFILLYRIYPQQDEVLQQEDELMEAAKEEVCTILLLKYIFVY